MLDLSVNRYREVLRVEVEHRPPKEVIADLRRFEEEIQDGLRELEEMLG